MAFAGIGRQIFAVFVCVNFTLASAPVQAKSKLKSQSFDESKFVADEYAPAKKKRRGPASTGPSNRKPEGKESNFAALNIDGNAVNIVSSRNKAGTIISQIIISKGRVEHWLDKNGDGGMDVWEMRTSSGRMELSEPHNGRFLTMTIEHQLDDAAFIMKFGFQSESKMYRLYGVEKKPFHRQHYAQDFVVGCREKDAELQQFASELSKHLNTDPNAAANANQLKTAIKDQLIGAECKKAPFAEMVPNMVDGIMKVAMSDPYFENKKTKEEETKELVAKGARPQKGTFLNCLRHYELDTHASRIMSALGQFTSKVEAADRYKWAVSCENMPGELASYQFENPPTVYFHATKAELAKASTQKDLGTKDPTLAYARLFFHEMLHYSLIDDENIVEPIEVCCGQEGGEGSPACKELEKIVATRKMAQKVKNTVKDNVPDYGKLVEALRKGMGPQGDVFLDRFSNDLGQILTEKGNDKQAREAAIKKLMQEYFDGNNSKCMAFSMYESDAEAKNFCTVVKGIADKLAGSDLDKAALAPICAKYTFNDHGSFRKFASWGRLLISPTRASSSDEMRSLCQTYNGADEITGSDFAKASDEPLDYGYLSQKRSGNPDNMGDVQRETGSSTQIPGSSGTQVSYRDNNSSTRPIFTGDRTQSDEIRRHLDNTSGVYDRSESYAKSYSNTLARIAIPAAQASELQGSSNSSANSSSVSNSNRGSAPSMSKADKSVFQVQLPDPLSPATSMMAGTMGPSKSGRSAMAGPVSAAQAAANARLAARQVASVGGDKPAVAGGGGAAGASGAGGASGSNGSAGGANAGKAGVSEADKKKALAEQEADARALKNLLSYLQGPYAKVKPELVRPQVVDSLLRHKVQVVDDEGRVHGSGEVAHKLTYSSQKNRLELLVRKPASARKQR